MNVLLVSPLFAQHYDSGWFWFRALQQLGHTVTVWDYRLDRGNPPTQKQDFTIVLKGEGLDPQMFPQPRFVYWPDAFERTPNVYTQLRYYNRIFTPVYPCPKWAIWLPTGYDPSIHYNVDCVKRFESVYIGTLNSARKQLLVQTIHPSIVAGNGWNSAHIHNLVQPCYLHEFVHLVNLSTIAINIHQSEKVGVNRKLFELIPCTFTIVDDVPGVREILGEVADNVVYKNAEQARDLIEKYLYKPAIRRELWELEKAAIKEYTYKRAVEKVLAYVQ